MTHCELQIPVHTACTAPHQSIVSPGGPFSLVLLPSRAISQSRRRCCKNRVKRILEANQSSTSPGVPANGKARASGCFLKIFLLELFLRRGAFVRHFKCPIFCHVERNGNFYLLQLLSNFIPSPFPRHGHSTQAKGLYTVRWKLCQRSVVNRPSWAEISNSAAPLFLPHPLSCMGSAKTRGSSAARYWPDLAKGD